MVVEAMIKEGFSLQQRGESGHGNEDNDNEDQDNNNDDDDDRSVRKKISSLRVLHW
mgnify:CR=1 FL=1